MRKPYCLYTKNQTKLKRICKHESSSKSNQVVANIHVNLQFCGKAALKKTYHIIIQIPSERSERGKNTFCAFFHQKY